MKAILIVATAVALSACQHTMTLAERGGKGVYKGEVSETFTGMGDMKVTIDGQALSGSWTTASGRSFGYALVGNTPIISAFNNTAGNASSIMTSPDGGKLICKFNYGYMNGVGMCLLNDARLFDMQFSQ